jgi:hypothetical protein
MMAYTVTSLGPVNHNGAVYEEGQSIPDLTPEQSAPLLALGVIQKTTPPPAAKPPAK